MTEQHWVSVWCLLGIYLFNLTTANHDFSGFESLLLARQINVIDQDLHMFALKFNTYINFHPF